MNEVQSSEEKSQSSLDSRVSNHSALKVVAGAVAALLAWGVIANFADIKRYIRISRM
jgi:hypothetical protein